MTHRLPLYSLPHSPFLYTFFSNHFTILNIFFQELLSVIFSSFFFTPHIYRTCAEIQANAKTLIEGLMAAD